MYKWFDKASVFYFVLSLYPGKQYCLFSS